MLRKTKVKLQYTCNKCGHTQSSFFGKCPVCREFCVPVEKEVQPDKPKYLKRKKTLRGKTKASSKTRLVSIFTDDLSRCVITGTVAKGPYGVHVHHIFGGSNRKNSAKFGFVIPLRADWHNLASYGIHHDRQLDLKYKHMCQDYWLEHYGKKEAFIRVFGQWW